MPDRIVVDFKKNTVAREPEPSRDLFRALMHVIRRRRRSFSLTGGSAPAPPATTSRQPVPPRH